MRTAILDTNIYRSCGDARFERLLALEAACGVYAVADSWTINELVAGLMNPDHRERGSYISGVRRLEKRSLLGGSVIMPAEAQAHRLLFNEELQEHKDAIQAVADCAREAALVPEAEWSTDLRDRVDFIAAAVKAQEDWFADHFRALARALAEATRAAGGSVGRELKAQIQSEETLRADARATVVRAYERAGRPVPEPLAESDIERVLSVFRPGFVATALALEKVCCEGANLDRDENRNLLWDQEIAHNLGQDIHEHPTVIVTDDRFFRRAARILGREQGTVKLSDYEDFLSWHVAASR